MHRITNRSRARGVQAFLRRMFQKAGSKLVNALIRTQFGGCVPVPGEGWTAYLVGKMLADSSTYGPRIQRIFDGVKACIHSDFEPPADVGGRSIAIICCGREVDLGDVQHRLGLDKAYTILPEVAGLHVAEFRAVIASEDPDRGYLDQNLAHELCHALCYALLGTRCEIPWAREAYAERVADCAVPSGQAMVLRNHVDWLSGTALQSLPLSLAEVLTIPILHRDALEAGFHALATLFLHFLLSYAQHGYPELWDVFRAAVAEDTATPVQVMTRIERTLGKTIDEIQDMFFEHCAQEPAWWDPPPTQHSRGPGPPLC